MDNNKKNKLRDLLKKSYKGKTLLSIAIALTLIAGTAYFLIPFKLDAEPNLEKVYRLRNGNSNKYVDIPSTLKPGGEAIQYGYNGRNLNQLYALKPSSDKGYYNLINLYSLMVLGVKGDSKYDNAPIIQDVNQDKTYQRFAFEDHGNGGYRIKIRSYGKYLSVKDNSADSKAPIVQFPLQDAWGEGQTWYLDEMKLSNLFTNLDEFINYKYSMGDSDVNRIIETARLLGYKESDADIRNAVERLKQKSQPSPYKYYRIKSNYNGLYLENPNGSKKTNEVIRMYRASSRLGQIYRIVPTKNPGYYNIINIDSKLLLDVSGNNNSNDAQVVQYTANGQANQEFKFNELDNKLFRIAAKHSGKVLTVKSNSMEEGAALVQWDNKTSGVMNQDWSLIEADAPYSSLDDFINKRVSNDKVLNINQLVSDAKFFGYETNADKVTEMVNNLISSKGNAVFTDATGFITTYSMLNKRIDQIGFAGAHNAFSNNQDRRSSYAWDTYKTDHSTGTENHDISIGTMLAVGYRVIDLDIGDNGNGHTGSYHRYRLSGYSNLNGGNAILPKIKAYLDNNPGEIAIIHISDVYNGTIDLLKLRNSSTYHKGEAGYLKQFNNLITDMKDTGLLAMTYNYKGDNNTPFDSLYGSMSIPGNNIPWPTVGEMLKSGKRVLFLERDSGIAVDVPFKNQNGDPNNTTKANLNLTQSWLDGLKGGSKNRLINITFTEDWGAAAGDKNAAKINNNGVRIFDIISSVDKSMIDNGIDKVVNVVYVDYATGNKKQGGWIDVSPVDAVNRENYSNFGFPWSAETAGKWYWK